MSSGEDSKGHGRKFDAEQVDRLLSHGNRALETPLDSQASDWLSENVRFWIGRELGAYRITEYLDRGGMATVFRATRADGQFEQEVAIKVLRAPDAHDLVQRFERERRLLGRLKHANIAHIIDSGVEEGQPWIAMELIHGDPIDAYCDRARLSLDDRLALFVRAAKAVQFAHAQLIVHRDIKPSNILVTDAGEPKLLDFGIAKALQGEDKADLTGGALLLTPTYASPEQVLGEAVGTSSDVYQLGLLLYRLLAGLNAQSLESPSVADIKSVVVDHDPISPSNRVETTGVQDTGRADQIALARSSSVAEIRKRLRGDLDAIVLRALEKEPSERYSSVEKLIEDVENYQESRPVAARHPTGWYRAQKFARRHRGGVLISGLVGLLLMGSLVAVGISSRATIKAQQLALSEAEGARVVAEFWASVLENASPELSDGDELTVRELLEQSADRLNELSDQPRAYSRLLEATAGAYLALRIPETAEPMAREALAIRQEQGDPAATVEALRILAVALSDLGQLDESVTVGRRAILAASSENVSDLQKAQAHAALAMVLDQKGLHDEVREQALMAAALLEGRNDQVSKSELASIVTRLASNDLQQARYRSAIQQFERALSLLGPSRSDQANRAWVLRDLGHTYLEVDQDDKAVALLRESLAVTKEIWGEESSMILGNYVMLGRALCNLTCQPEAESIFEEALVVAKKTIGREHGNYARILHDYAEVFRLRGDFARERDVRDEAMRIADAFFGADHSTSINIRLRAARIDLGSGYYADSVLALQEVVDDVKVAFGDDHLITFSASTSLASALLANERFDEASAAMSTLRDEAPTLLDGKFWFNRNNLLAMSKLAFLAGSLDEARQFAEEALAVHLALDDSEAAILIRSLSQRIRVHADESPNAVRSDVERVLRLIESHPQPPTIQSQLLHTESALGIAVAGYANDAAEICSNALNAMQTALTADQPLLAYGRSHCAEVFIRNDQSGQAMRELESALPVLKTVLGESSWRTVRAQFLSGLAMGQADDAEVALARLRNQLGDASPLVRSLAALKN